MSIDDGGRGRARTWVVFLENVMLHCEPVNTGVVAVDPSFMRWSILYRDRTGRHVRRIGPRCRDARDRVEVLEQLGDWWDVQRMRGEV